MTDLRQAYPGTVVAPASILACGVVAAAIIVASVVRFCAAPGAQIRASHHRAGRSGSAGVTPACPDGIPGRAAGLPGRGPGYRVPGPASGPTFVPSHLLSGRVVRRKPATLPRAAAVSSHGSTGHWFQATTPLYRSRPIRG